MESFSLKLQLYFLRKMAQTLCNIRNICYVFFSLAFLKSVESFLSLTLCPQPRSGVSLHRTIAVFGSKYQHINVSASLLCCSKA